MSGVVDPDDVEYLLLEQRFSMLMDEAKRLADPEAALWSWIELSLAVMLRGQCPGRPLSWILSLTLQRTIVDLRRSV